MVQWVNAISCRYQRILTSIRASVLLAWPVPLKLWPMGISYTLFFASHAVKLLQVAYIDALDEKVSQPPGQCSAMLHTLIGGAEGIYCSTGSQAVVGVTPDNAHEVLVGGYELNWSGPPGVVSLSSEADVVLTY